MGIHNRPVDRRRILFGGAAALGALTWSGVFAQKDMTQDSQVSTDLLQMSREERRELVASSGYVWMATSPSTHAGDVFDLVATNRGEAAIELIAHVTIMDHTKHDTIPVILQMIEIGPGEQRTLTVTNDYGTANHFSTTIVADTGAIDRLGLQVTLRDISGTETTSFNERAFWIMSSDEAEALDKREENEDQGHGGY